MKFKLPILTTTALVSLPLASITAITSCTPTQTITARFTQNEFSVGIDRTVQLSIENGDFASFNCCSSNEKVATVDSNGVVTGHAIGTTTIALSTKDNKIVDKCTVAVADVGNSFMFGNNLITKSGVVFEKYGEAVTYDLEKNTLTLNNATIKASEIGLSRNLTTCMYNDRQTVTSLCNFMIAFPDNFIPTKFEIVLKGENHIINDVDGGENYYGGIYVGDDNTLKFLGGGSLTFETNVTSQCMMYGRALIIDGCTIQNIGTSVYEFGIYSNELWLEDDAHVKILGDEGNTDVAIFANESFRFKGQSPGKTNDDDATLYITNATIGIKAPTVLFAWTKVTMKHVAYGIVAGDSCNVEKHSVLDIDAEAAGIQCENNADYFQYDGSQVTIKIPKEGVHQTGLTCGNCIIEGMGSEVDRSKTTILNIYTAQGMALQCFRATFMNFADISLISDWGSGINVNNSTTTPLKDPALISVISSWVTARGTLDHSRRQPGDGSIWGAGYFTMSTQYTKYKDGDEDKYHLVIERPTVESPAVFAFLPKAKQVIDYSDDGLPTNAYLDAVNIEPIKHE